MDFDSWDDFRFILAASNAGSLTAAASALGVDQSTVTRRLRACEQRAGTKLFHRLRGGVELTSTGKAFAKTAAQVEERLYALEREVSASSRELGPVRFTLPNALAALWIDDLVAFAKEQPGLQLELVVDDNVRDLDRREADVALRRVHLPPEHLVGRRLCQMADALYGAPMLRRRELDALPWIGWAPDLRESTLDAARRQFSPSQPFALYANSLLVLLEAARKGRTALNLPCIIGDAEPQLTRLTNPVLGEKPLWLLTHPDLHRSPSVRVVMDFVTRLIGEKKSALLGE